MDLVFNFLTKFIVFLLIFFIVCTIYTIPFRVYYHFKGYRKKKGTYTYVGYGNFFKKVFYEFPKQYVFDYLNRDPDEFRDYGFHMICGKQGTGKTITLVYLLMRYQKMYPKLKVATNMYYKYQAESISSWKDLVFKSNGIYGMIHVIDEVQNWFCSNQSKDFPPEMIKEITQQRKQRKVIFGTSQVFSRVAKPIREQVYMVYEPVTLFGCITFVRKYEPELDSKDGSIVKSKFRGMFWFVHNREIREAFDTYKKIEDLSLSGFSDSSRLYSQPIVNNNVVKLASKNIIKRG